MEPLDEFDSLLKGAADQYNKTPLTEQSVSAMIDERLAKSRKMFVYQFIKEIKIIVICMLWIIFYLVLNYFGINGTTPILTGMNIVYWGTLIYLIAGMVLFTKMLKASRSQKDTHIKDYLTGIYQKTNKALLIYLWLSTASAVFMTLALLIYLQVNWIIILSATVAFGVTMHFINIWYIRVRFGKMLDEMKSLMAAFD
jgi:hypothetical protein